MARTCERKEVQRLRVTFARGNAVKFITHLDLMRFWERALRRAGIALAYSHGYSPHPRLSLAAPLAVGVTSVAELMDVFLERRYALTYFTKQLIRQLPSDVEITQVQEVGLRWPSSQSLVRFAEYEVVLDSPLTPQEIQQGLEALMAKKALPWQRQREDQVRQYDLRALIHSLWLVERRFGECILGMRLKTDNEATGRPDDVCAALEYADVVKEIRRTKLILASESTLGRRFG